MRRSFVDAVPLVGALVLAGAVLRGFAYRIAHPFDLEWMEGGMLAHAWRLQHGLPLYTDAGPEWIPYIYPPGYAALLAAVGPDYALGRALSIVGTLVAAAALVRLFAVRGEPAVGVVLGACFLGLWRASGAFYDLVRPDGVGIALFAWSVVLATERRRGMPVAAGLLLAAAFAFKHNLAAFGFPLALGLWMRDGWRPALGFGLAAAVPAGLFTLLLQLRTGGRFLTYLLSVPAVHPTVGERILPGTPGELTDWLLPALVAGSAWVVGTLPVPRRAVWAMLPVAVVAGVAVAGLPPPSGVAIAPYRMLVVGCVAIAIGLGAALLHGAWAPLRRVADGRWWLAVGVGGTALVVAGLMRGHNGGFSNVLIPAHWAACAGLGLAVLDARRRWPVAPVAVATSLALALQVAWIGAKLEIGPILPDPEDAPAGHAIVDRIRQCPPGPVLSPHAPWLAAQAGREPGLHLIALWDVNHRGGPYANTTRSFVEAAAQHRWPCIVTGRRDAQGFGVDKSYALAETFPVPGKAMMPKTGWRVRPTALLVPKE